jgi:hypothetical protein
MQYPVFDRRQPSYWRRTTMPAAKKTKDEFVEWAGASMIISVNQYVSNPSAADPRPSRGQHAASMRPSRGQGAAGS